MTTKNREKWARRCTASSLVAFALLHAGAASAEDCTQLRPTDPSGYGGFSYGNADVASYATPEGHVRVFYATNGPHAPATPDAPATIGAVAEAALNAFVSMGFSSPRSDEAYLPCASNGGDGRLDVYLVDFPGADGTAVAEQCDDTGLTSRCSGFVLIENDFDKSGYTSFDEGARTVMPHELFHLIQDAYDTDIDRFWAEGTAQWATKKLYPDLVDLERFLPAYFAETSRALDVPPGGVTTSFLYGTAIWPVFLDERHGSTIVRDIFEEVGASGETTLAATDKVFAKKNTTLAEEFSTFATWNAATGTRASETGYTNAKTYPMVDVKPFPDGIDTSVDGIMSGLASRYYLAQESTPRQFVVDADPLRIATFVIPIEDGKARLDRRVALPATIEGNAILVVSSTSTKKTDASFTVHAKPAPPDDTHEEPHSSNAEETSGCSIRGIETQSRYGFTFGFALMATVAGFRRRAVHLRRASSSNNEKG